MIDVAKFFSIGAKYGDLLDRIHREGHVYADQSTMRAFAELRSIQVVIGDDEGKFRLSRTCRDMLDRSVGRRGALGSAAGIVEDLGALRMLLIEISADFGDGDEQDRLDHIEEAHGLIWSIRDALDMQLAQFEMHLHTGFQEARTLDQRLRRNRFYFDRANALNESISQLQDHALRDHLAESGCREVRREYDRMISRYIPHLSARLTAVIGKLRVLLARNTEIMERTRRLRLIGRALREISHTEMVEAVLAHPELFPILPRFSFGVITDPNDQELEIARIRHAATMQPKEPQRAKGKALKALTPVPFDERHMDLPKSTAEIILDRFGKDVGNEKFSVRRWLETFEHGEDKDVAFELVLQNVLASPDHFDCTFQPPLDQVFTSMVSDIEVRRAA